DAQLGQLAMSEFLVHQRLRNDAHGFAAARENRIRDLTHQPDFAATVDEAESTVGQSHAEFTGRLIICGNHALVRTAKNTNLLHQESLSTPAGQVHGISL